MSRLSAFALVIVAMGLVALGAQAGERPAEAVGAATPEAGLVAASGAQPTVSDTLRYSVRAGRALIVALPTTHAGAEATYKLLDAPSLSWMVDRSFMWRTTAGERGALPILVERTVAGSSPDTLVLLVEVRQ